MRLEDGAIYVVPANHHVDIVDHHVRLLKEGGGSRPSPSIDLLLSTAAASYGENLIAVILSGTGSDGTAGARDVKRHGGVVIIQNPETASFRSMAESLPPTSVDVVANADRIGPILKDLITGAYVTSKNEEDTSFKNILDLVQTKSGIDFTTYKSATIQRRLRRRMVATEICPI